MSFNFAYNAARVAFTALIVAYFVGVASAPAPPRPKAHVCECAGGGP